MAKLKCITLFLCAVVFSTAVMAEDYVRNGQPCLSGICVGDEISTLTGVKWKPALTTTQASFFGRPIRSKAKEYIKKLLKGFAPNSEAAVTAAAPYLLFGSFDGQAIPKLAKVTGFCERMPHVMVGIFSSTSGHETTVYVDVVPGDDPSNQSLRVQRIQRTFPREYTSEQINELSKQLGERYQGVMETPFPSGSKPTWHFAGSERKLTLYAPMGDGEHIRDQLMKYPGCGKSLKID